MVTATIDSDALLLDGVYLQTLSQTGGQSAFIISAYLPHVECVSCLGDTSFVLQAVPGLHHGWDNSRKAYVLSASEPKAIYAAVKTLRSQGFDPQILKPDHLRDERIKMNRGYLTKLAVAGAVSGNIMLLTLGSYGGATGRVDRLFNTVSGLLFLVIIGFSASPLYFNAFNALKARRLSIDVPLVLAIAMGGVLSYVNLWRSSGAVYFDSLSALVFLILSTRYIQRRSEQAAYDRIDAASKMVPPLAMRIGESGQAVPVSIDKLNPGDVLLIQTGDVIPVDSSITTVSGLAVHEVKAYLDLSVVTGESTPQSVGLNTLVSAGAVNVGESITVTVNSRVTEGKLSRLMSEAAAHKRNRAHIVDFSERVARVFTVVVVSISALAFVYFLPQGLDVAIARVLAFLLVSCPCALALAVPLTFAVAQGRAAVQSIFIKSGRSFEVLASKPHFVFDKTGTLTKGEFKVVGVSSTEDSSEYLSIVAALESVSRHPIAKALVKYVEAQGISYMHLILDSISEELGRGVSGLYKGEHYAVKAYNSELNSESMTSAVALYKNHSPVMIFKTIDEPYSEAKNLIHWLRSSGHRVSLLSGDIKSVCDYVGKAVGIDHIVSSASPADKQNYIKDAQKHGAVVMVGDGANDSAALMTADLGIAVRGGLYSSLSAADIYIMAKSKTCGIKNLVWLVSAAKSVNVNVRTALSLSVVYNVAASIAALSGYISPLVAAVAMPVSSFVVVLLAIRKPQRLVVEI